MPKNAAKLSDESVDRLLELYLDDFEAHAADCVFIRDHNTAQIKNLHLNAGQKILHAVAEKQMADAGFVRIIGLKSRRFGFSTYVEARFYRNTSMNPNRNAFIVAHEKESTATLFEMAKLMQERNPIAPSTRYSNEKLLRFDNEKGTGLKSEYRIATAENVDAGRSQGVHYLHGSEEAFWKDGETLLNGLLQCLPQPPSPHECFRESTANGFGNSFQRDVFKSYAEGRFPYYQQDGITYAWKVPGNDWVLVFIPWFVHERYTRPFENDKQRQDFETEINKTVFDKQQMKWVESVPSRLRRKYSLTLEQLNWREWMIENNIRAVSREERERKFAQEYPSNVEEAFLSSGSNVYGKELCDAVEEECREPLLVGEPVDRLGVTKVRPSSMGSFRLYSKPDERKQYFITVDPGGGIKPSHEAKNTTPDPTCIDVWERISGEQIAQWHGHIDYTQIGDLIALIGKMFNNPLAAVELMNHGYTVVGKLTEIGYPQYEHKPGEPGWVTDKRTKPQMVDRLLEFAQDGNIQIRSRETVSEMRTFVEANGKFGAESGCHDDRVMSACIASMMLSLLPSKLNSDGYVKIGTAAKSTEHGKYNEVFA